MLSLCAVTEWDAGMTKMHAVSYEDIIFSYWTILLMTVVEKEMEMIQVAGKFADADTKDSCSDLKLVIFFQSC